MAARIPIQGLLLSVLSPAPGKAISDAVECLLERYSDPRRKWHNLAYLELGIKEHARLLGSQPSRDHLLAWAYHAYELGDEEASAVALLRDASALGIPLEYLETNVASLILASNPINIRTSVVGDMRLAIYGQPRVRYLAYFRKLRAEYPFLDGEAWRLGRWAMLKLLASRNPIYFKAEFESAFAMKARQNIEAEMSLLLGDDIDLEKGKGNGIQISGYGDAGTSIEAHVPGALPGESKG